MSLWIDEKYLRLVSPQLERFTQKHEHTYNFRCPLCGDSERIRTKARGYIFPKSRVLMYKCHNCAVALPFSALLKRLSRPLYDEYLLETFRDEQPANTVQTPSNPAAKTAPVDELLGNYVFPLSQLAVLRGALYPVVSYANQRQIPKTQFHRLFATMHAQTWLTPLVGEKAQKVKDGEVFLVLPLRLSDGTWYGCQLRSLTQKIYITFRWSETYKYPVKVFGLEAWKLEQETFVVEGPLDSLFVPNALAACGSDLFGAVQGLQDNGVLPHTAVRTYVFDNEPRNKEIVRMMTNVIALHERIFIWPSGYPKDINDVYRSNLGENFLDVLRQRTFSGLQAQLEFTRWRSRK